MRSCGVCRQTHRHRAQGAAKRGSGEELGGVCEQGSALVMGRLLTFSPPLMPGIGEEPWQPQPGGT